ncbi:hypothetical protein [Tunicatimonas pelagia]|uniref:hypothetical protein n=1 Tax=Tunicatimonas pelagia TaxID=931531 RepID=UPI002666E45B|nr:hypothetical protein [Tunicatimonas pelagia]WKN46467.1 hypothetical protein P0M28_30420 [Tunicatimonas pelagia]
MLKNKPTSLIPYLVLALGMLIVQPIISWYRDFTAVEMVRIEYLPEGASSPVVYRVEATSVQQVGECITFPTTRDEYDEYITLCERFQRVVEPSERN